MMSGTASDTKTADPEKLGRKRKKRMARQERQAARTAERAAPTEKPAAPVAPVARVEAVIPVKPVAPVAPVAPVDASEVRGALKDVAQLPSGVSQRPPVSKEEHRSKQREEKMQRRAATPEITADGVSRKDRKKAKRQERREAKKAGKIRPGSTTA